MSRQNIAATVEQSPPSSLPPSEQLAKHQPNLAPSTSKMASEKSVASVCKGRQWTSGKQSSGAMKAKFQYLAVTMPITSEDDQVTNVTPTSGMAQPHQPPVNAYRPAGYCSGSPTSASSFSSGGLINDNEFGLRSPTWTIPLPQLSVLVFELLGVKKYYFSRKRMVTIATALAPLGML